MNNKALLRVVVGMGLALLALPTQAALLAGTVLTIDQGSGDCVWSFSQHRYNCTNLSGSYVMGGWSAGSTNFSPSTIGFFSDGYDDATGAFTGGATGGAGIIIGVAQPYEGAAVGVGIPYDPAIGRNISTAFQSASDGISGGPWGTFYSVSPIVDNGDGTLDFSGWNMVWAEGAAVFGQDGYTPFGDVIFTVTPGGAFGAGRYSLDVFTERFIGEFENLGLLLHLEGSIRPVPLPAAAWLLGSGSLGLALFARRRKLR